MESGILNVVEDVVNKKEGKVESGISIAVEDVVNHIEDTVVFTADHKFCK